MPVDSDLRIQPFRDDFDIPTDISIDIIVDNNIVYTDNLKYEVANEYLGIYSAYIDSKELFKRNIKEVYITIRFNDDSSSILLE